jgi:hypothetical protein
MSKTNKEFVQASCDNSLTTYILYDEDGKFMAHCIRYFQHEIQANVPQNQCLSYS